MRQRWQGVRAALLRQCPNHHHSIMPVSTAAPHALQRTPHPTLPPVGWLGGHFQLVRGQDLLPHSRDRRRRSAPRHRDGADARLPGEHCRPATDACTAAQSTADPPQTPARLHRALQMRRRCDQRGSRARLCLPQVSEGYTIPYLRVMKVLIGSYSSLYLGWGACDQASRTRCRGARAQ